MEQSYPVHELINELTVLALKNNLKRITRIELWIGALNKVSPELFKQRFLESILGSIAAGASVDTHFSLDINSPDAIKVLVMSIDAESVDQENYNLKAKPAPAIVNQEITN